ncbi:MAG: hypothetical protein P1R74_10250 [Sedimenticola sp.]|nr:hypothetical protein [Sedimenticola sp.]
MPITIKRKDAMPGFTTTAIHFKHGSWPFWEPITLRSRVSHQNTCEPELGKQHTSPTHF